jgi:hypothetical protein
MYKNNNGNGSHGKHSSELIDNICNYIKGEEEWLAFGLRAGNTRSMVYGHFIHHYNSLNGNQIVDQVKDSFDRELTDEEIEKLCEIIRAWGEWRFILRKAREDNIDFKKAEK